LQIAENTGRQNHRGGRGQSRPDHGRLIASLEFFDNRNELVIGAVVSEFQEFRNVQHGCLSLPSSRSGDQKWVATQDRKECKRNANWRCKTVTSFWLAES